MIVPTCHPERRHLAKGLCKPCYQKLWRAGNMDSVRKYRHYYNSGPRWESKLSKTYGLTVQGFNDLHAKQSGVCAICKLPPRGRVLNVDHCHRAGHVRGLLCGKCNTAIGLLSDKPGTIRRAARYLEGKLNDVSK
jgi:hypothetical protein